MSTKELPRLSYTKTDNVPDSTAIFDRDASLLVINLDKPNDYSGEFINSGRVCISLDSDMAVEDLEVKFSTSDVNILNDLKFPVGVPAQVCFLDSFVSVKLMEEINTNNSMDLVNVIYSSEEEDNILHLQVAEGIILDVTLDNLLAGIWIKKIVAR